MSRFADPAAVTLVDFGPCLCPGAPHESDWVKVRAELSVSEIRRASDLKNLGDDALVAAGLTEFVPEWNLLGPNGEAWPPSADSIGALKAANLVVLIQALAKAVAESGAVPNASGAPSAASLRGRASPTRRQSRKRTT